VEIDIPDSFWGPAGTLLGAVGVMAGLFRYGARMAGWVKRTEETYFEPSKKAFEAVEVLERRMYHERTDMEQRLDAMERTFATKEELAAVEARLSGSVSDLRGDVRDLGRYLAAASHQTNENLHKLIGDVAEIKGHLGKAGYTKAE